MTKVLDVDHEGLRSRDHQPGTLGATRSTRPDKEFQ